MQPLPLGINTLASIRSNDMVYVDKTEMALSLIKYPGRFFLSRPRRFGKSLFVDTLKEIFEGNRDLFQGLFIENKWDWSTSFPVIKIDFSEGTLQNREELDERIRIILKENGRRLGVTYDESADIPGIFADLIRESVKAFGQPAIVLVDEYDKPLLDNIDHPDSAVAMREGVKNLYSVLKGQDANLRFVFMTGVSKFCKVSLFSGVNQLDDITLDARYSALCGYTQSDLETSFADHLAGTDREKLKHWYNGYKWFGNDAVYNPYDILLFISKGHTYRSYWFETGTPSFLVKLFQRNRYFLPDLENIEVGEEVLSSFDVERINPVTLLFQTGYLTIDSYNDDIGELLYTLKLPNLEVRKALNTALINGFAQLDNTQYSIKRDLLETLRNGRTQEFFAVITRLFASIPWRNFTNNDIADFEGYYASVLYAFFASLDGRVIPEDITNHGQADLTVIFDDHVYVMEIKVVKAESVDDNTALKQVIEKNYAQKYKGLPGKQVHELGLVFSSTTRNLILGGEGIQ